MPKRRPAKRRITVREMLVLLNSPNRNTDIESGIQKTREVIEIALDRVVSAQGKGQAYDLKKILKIALNLNRAKGTYEGLCEGWRLHAFEMKIKADPRMYYLTNRIRRFPEGTGEGKDLELCRYMDGQVRRLSKLRVVKPDDIPFPRESWGTRSWIEALKKNPSTVSKFISQARKKVLSQDYTFLLAWKRIGENVPGGPRKQVKHRNLHLDKLYD